MKELIRKILIIGFINRYLVQSFIHLKGLFNFKYLSRLPVIGTFTFKNCNGISYKLSANGYDPIANEVYWTQGNGPDSDMVNFLYKYGKKIETCIDIGANIGFISIHMNLLPSVKKVYSFEPLPEAFVSLQNNIELNSFKNCYIYKTAVGKEVGTASFFVPNVKAIPSSSSLDSNFYKDNQEMTVNITTLDYFTEEEKIKKIDIVKIDVEGKEIDVLMGMINILTNHRPLIFCEILKKSLLEEIYAFINNFNYYIYQMKNSDILFIKNLTNFEINCEHNFILSPKLL